MADIAPQWCSCLKVMFAWTELQHVSVVVFIVVCVICCWLIGCVYGNQNNSNKIISSWLFASCQNGRDCDGEGDDSSDDYPMNDSVHSWQHDNRQRNVLWFNKARFFFFVRVNVCVCVYRHVYGCLCFLQQSSIPNKKYTSIKSISSGALKTFKGSEKTLCYSTTSHRIVLHELWCYYYICLSGIVGVIVKYHQQQQIITTTTTAARRNWVHECLHVFVELLSRTWARERKCDEVSAIDCAWVCQ